MDTAGQLLKFTCMYLLTLMGATVTVEREERPWPFKQFFALQVQHLLMRIFGPDGAQLFTGGIGDHCIQDFHQGCEVFLFVAGVVFQCLGL